MNKGELKYIVGDTVYPQEPNIFIIQIVNDVGKYGAGLSGAISKRWPNVEQEYRKWFRSQDNFKLGEIQIVQVKPAISVVNMIAQHDVISYNNPKPIKYDALSLCMDKVAELAIKENRSICSGRFGAGLAGGSWSIIESLIIEKFIDRGINVSIYDLPT